MRGKTVPGWASIMAVTMFLAGIQLMVLGLIGEYLGKMYMATKRCLGYLVAKTNIKEYKVYDNPKAPAK